MNAAGAALPARVEIVEVSPRDGLQNEAMPVSTQDKLELIAQHKDIATCEAIGKADISRAEAGRRSGVPESTLYGLLKGEDPIDMEQARKLAKGLNVPLVSIILRAEEIMADASADPAADR